MIYSDHIPDLFTPGIFTPSRRGPVWLDEGVGMSPPLTFGEARTRFRRLDLPECWGSWAFLFVRGFWLRSMVMVRNCVLSLSHVESWYRGSRLTRAPTNAILL